MKVKIGWNETYPYVIDGPFERREVDIPELKYSWVISILQSYEAVQSYLGLLYRSSEGKTNE